MATPLRNSLISQWHDDGYVLFDNTIPEEKIDKIKECAEELRLRPYLGGEGFHTDRISLSHQILEDVLDVPFFPEIYHFIRYAMDDEPILLGSINFHVGTEQPAHQYLPFFYVKPQNSMVGIWLALEDIHPDSGPLFYYPGSHKFDMIRGEDIVARHPEFAEQVELAKSGNLEEKEINKLVSEMQKILPVFWNELIEEKNLKRKNLEIKKGQILVWHSKLLHGGSRISDPSKTRKSIVFHMIGESANLYNDKQFILYKNSEFSSITPVPIDKQTENYLFGKYRSLGMITYHEGAQKKTLKVKKL